MRGLVLATTALLIGPAWGKTPLPPDACQHPMVLNSLRVMVNRDPDWLRVVSSGELEFRRITVVAASADHYQCIARIYGDYREGSANYSVDNVGEGKRVDTTLHGVEVDPPNGGAAQRWGPYIHYEVWAIYLIGLPLLVLAWLVRVAAGTALKGVKYGAEAFIAVRILQRLGIVKKARLP